MLVIYAFYTPCNHQTPPGKCILLQWGGINCFCRTGWWWGFQSVPWSDCRWIGLNHDTWLAEGCLNQICTTFIRMLYLVRFESNFTVYAITVVSIVALILYRYFHQSSRSKHPLPFGLGFSLAERAAECFEWQRAARSDSTSLSSFSPCRVSPVTF